MAPHGIGISSEVQKCSTWGQRISQTKLSFFHLYHHFFFRCEILEREIEPRRVSLFKQFNVFVLNSSVSDRVQCWLSIDRAPVQDTKFPLPKLRQAYWRSSVIRPYPHLNLLLFFCIHHHGILCYPSSPLCSLTCWHLPNSHCMHSAVYRHTNHPHLLLLHICNFFRSHYTAFVDVPT